MDIEIKNLAQEHNLFSCFECGKCTASCPMGEIFEDFSYEISPRGLIEKVIMEADLSNDKTIWYCLSCDVCTEGCPCGIDYKNFIQAVRLLLIERGERELGLVCKSCDRYYIPNHTLEYVQDNVGKDERTIEFLELCYKCRRFHFSLKVKENLPGRKVVKCQSRL